MQKLNFGQSRRDTHAGCLNLSKDMLDISKGMLDLFKGMCVIVYTLSFSQYS